MQKTAHFMQEDHLQREASSFVDFVAPDGLPLRVLRFEPQKDTGLHDHKFYELVIVFGGESCHNTIRERYQIGAGDVFLIRPGEIHGYEATNGLNLVNILYWQEQLNLPLYDLKNLPGYHAFFELEPEMRRQHGFRKHLQVSKRNLSFLAVACRELENCLSRNAPGCLFHGVAIFMQIIGCISGSFQSDADRAAEHELLWQHSQLLSDIERHWLEPFPLDALAKRHGMSASTLYRLFIRLFGQSPLEYLIGLRIARAQELLVRSSQSIGEVAQATGFQDSNYFSRCFRRVTGETPSCYRKRMQG